MEETGKRGQGRESKYKSEYDKQVFRLCLLGATDKEIAAFFEVNQDTIQEWKVVHPTFSVSIKEGKIEADSKVAESLYKRAMGIEYKEVTYEKIGTKDELEEEGQEDQMIDIYRKKIVTKFIPPDVAAANIFLKNRRGRNRVDKDGQVWADKQEHELSGELAVTNFEVIVNGSKSTLLEEITNQGKSGLSGEQASLQAGLPDNS